MKVDLTKHYEEDLKEVLQDIKKLLCAPSLDDNKISSLFKDANDTIGLMEIHSPQSKETAKLYKQQLTSLRQQHEEALRKQLLPSSSSSSSTDNGVPLTKSMDQRQRMLDNKEKIARSSERLKEAMRIAMETEEIGRNTLAELHSQRGHMISINEKLGGVKANLDTSSKTISEMEARSRWVKIMTFGLMS
eukprot:TRINITY_DN1572_c0_g1_i4.p1 TRINITY_DN1572_c0_g1~~TRINITY_DN1572_c0_g1_i4.p1  ORF type:complete len:190 (-),score=36.02 TRINITY_DN1572_c0_g1_i4:198-767(-)